MHSLLKMNGLIVFLQLLQLLQLFEPTISWLQSPPPRSTHSRKNVLHPLQAGKKPLSREMEIAIKMKRLKQLKKEGKDYKSYITEQARIENEKEGESDEEKAELQNKIVEYKEKVEKERLEKERRQQINALFLPDVGEKEIGRDFYKSLTEKSSSEGKMNVEALDMPDVHAFNTKRYEIQWMNYMRNSQPPLSSFDIVIAHGTSADAMLRYIESDFVKNLILIDGSSM